MDNQDFLTDDCKKYEKISIINSKNKIVKTSSNSFLVSIAILIFIVIINIITIFFYFYIF